MAALLIDFGATIEQPDGLGDTALIVAAKTADLEMVGLLMDRCADVNARNNKGETARTWAAFHGKKELSALLRRTCDTATLS